MRVLVKIAPPIFIVRRRRWFAGIDGAVVAAGCTMRFEALIK